ncbi:hypothetical protein BBK82_29350 [Lentzea guizhouensis]|uniref:Immunity protein Imm33 domain-containing protein n=1 Tax=Lentzea guizhouensis TaxID=1586287 RepID=A0A1B2HZE1_9PSEU|nr:hypothetical protein BBK82_29350 [Lentzea guizhouensis]
MWFGDLAKAAIVSARVARDGVPAGWLYREDPDHDGDSGWRVFAGDESQEYVDDSANAAVVPLRDLIKAEPALEELFEAPSGSAFERGADGFVKAER